MDLDNPSVSEVRRSPFSEETIELVLSEEPPNRQLFENSELADHPVTQAAHNDPDRLFSANETYVHDSPNLAIIHEKPEHRIAVYLKAQGHSNKEVAAKLGYTIPWVSQLTRQPWFRLRLVQELKDAGVDQIQAVLKSTALDSIFTLIDIRDDATAPKAARSACANSLLDRFLGKPKQTIEHEEKGLPKTSEITAIDEQLKVIDNELQPK